MLLTAGFLLYVVVAVAAILVFMLRLAPEHGTTSIYVYITICSLAGSLSVMSCKVCLQICTVPTLQHGRYQRSCPTKKCNAVAAGQLWLVLLSAKILSLLPAVPVSNCLALCIFLPDCSIDSILLLAGSRYSSQVDI